MIGDTAYSGYRHIVDINIEVHQACVEERDTYRPVWGRGFKVRASLTGPQWNATVEKSLPVEESDISGAVRVLMDSLRDWLPQCNPPEDIA